MPFGYIRVRSHSRAGHGVKAHTRKQKRTSSLVELKRVTAASQRAWKGAHKKGISWNRMTQLVKLTRRLDQRATGVRIDVIRKKNRTQSFKLKKSPGYYSAPGRLLRTF